uniref:BMA-RIG-1, isoform c n=1 Tax=Brugia malayi TaxID=6279 RepID=A0A1I9G1X1_BRUMA|nr:BMA-RIG-1, isoform c [Brugia malayi]
MEEALSGRYQTTLIYVTMDLYIMMLYHFAGCRIILLLINQMFLAFPENRIFKLPRLILHADQYYLVKSKVVVMSCQIEPGWRGATMADVHWIKDGVPIGELENENMRNELLVDGPTLKIQNGKHHTEGDYQCSALIRGVRLSNGKHVDTHLVSAPVKFRRARITKFEKVAPESVAALQGQIARLPCSGMPDVVPGPPEITFEKEGYDGLLGIPGDERYLSTSSGIQIPLSKLSDSGNYYCVVRNTFTNQTRKSPHFVKLEVLTKRYSSIEPALVYPVTSSSINGPIVVDVVKGQTALLECIVTSTKIIWTRLYPGETAISVSSEKARLRQIWGNLQIQQVNEADTGIYICESMALFSPPTVKFPKVYYNLRVHAPTDVQLMLGQLATDKSWKLSCLALNLHYEIPMVYMNGLALIDAMVKLGVPPHTNFFTNPINATLTSSVALSGSVQCISRPAMDEAEVYGNGLERGRAMNLYVDNRISQQVNLILQGPENSTKIVGETAQMVCLVVPRTTKTIWTKDGKRMALIGKKRIRLVGTASLQISDVQLEDEGWYTCEVTDNTNHVTRSSSYLKIIPKEVFLQNEKDSGMKNQDIKNIMSKNAATQYQEKGEGKLQSTTSGLREPLMDVPRAFISGRNVQVLWSLPKNYAFPNKITSFQIEFRAESNKKWIMGELVDGHVRAVTIKALLPGNRYQFRVLAKMLDQSIVPTQPTNWLKIEQVPESNEINAQINITFFSPVSDTVLQLRWNYTASNYIKSPETFLVSYATVSDKNYTHTIRLNSSFSMTNLSNLLPSTEYRAIVEVEFADKTSQRSEPSVARTLDRRSQNLTANSSASLLTLFNHPFSYVTSSWNTQSIILFLITSFLSSVVFIIFGLLLYSLKQRYTRKISRDARDKFMDASHRIFNEQRVQKSHLYCKATVAMSAMSDVNEFTLLKMKSSEDQPRSVVSLKSFSFSKDYGIMPNLYGEEDNFLEEKNTLTSFKDTPWTNGKIYENVISEASDIQEPVQKALRTNDSHEESFWLKGIMNNGQMMQPNDALVIPLGIQLLAPRRTENSTQYTALPALSGAKRTADVPPSQKLFCSTGFIILLTAIPANSIFHSTDGLHSSDNASC